MRCPVHLTVLGDGPLGDRVPVWIDDLGIADRVTWHGHVPWEQVRTAYRTHDVFLFNSLRDSFGSQLLEAMAHGLPIVTLDLHGARAFVPDAASIKVAAKTPEATAKGLARALDTLARHPDRWQEMQQAGRDLTRQMTWARKAERITALYETLVVPAHSPERPSLQRADSLRFLF
jgi:glycosyltransferase involved in cell wall biosynthesis